MKLCYNNIRQVKIILFLVAIFIGVLSLVVSHFLVSDMAKQERLNMEVWAEAMRTLSNADENTDLTLVLKVLNGNTTIPIVAISPDGQIQNYRNLHLKALNYEDSIAEIHTTVAGMKDKGHIIKVYMDESDNDDYIEICYDESIMLQRLAVYPYVQLLIVLVFAIIALSVLFISKKAEQNNVWVGLSKETAHQLGTPISSLMAWMEILKETYPDDVLLPEMDKDIRRLEMIAERFSKIGSKPQLSASSINELIERVVDYMSKRVSSKVIFIKELPAEEIVLPLCAPLFEWVLENLCKNAVDAMDGQGTITVKCITEEKSVVIEVTDTGRGISKKNFDMVFRPGYTTKKRGWGLGLSLAKRIVEEYHKGHIFIKNSEPNKGTTFRMELKKS